MRYYNTLVTNRKMQCRAGDGLNDVEMFQTVMWGVING